MATTTIKRPSALRLATNARRQHLLLEFTSFLVGLRAVEGSWAKILGRLKWVLDFERVEFATRAEPNAPLEVTVLFPQSDAADRSGGHSI